MAAANADVNYSRFERNTGDNWVTYRVQTLDAMFMYDATDILEGIELEPAIIAGDAASVVANTSWKVRNRQAYGYLSFTQSPASKPYVSEVPVGNVPLYWARLQLQHFTGTGPGALNLVDRTVGARLKGTVAAYVSELQGLRRELRDLEAQLAAAPVPAGGVAQTLADVLVTSTMLRGLTREFQVTVDRLHSTPNLTMPIATQSVLAREEYLKYEREHHGKNSGKAFAAYDEDGSADLANEVPLMVCTFPTCRKAGHVEANCFVKFPALREAAKLARKTAKDKSRDGKAKAAHMVEDEDVRGDVFGAYSAVILDDEDEVPPDLLENSVDEEEDVLPILIGDENHIPTNCSSPFDNFALNAVPVFGSDEHLLVAMFTRSTEETGNYLEGILDSGASHLFVSPSTPVENLDPCITKSVLIANGVVVRTTGCGTINGIPAHVGPFPTNLISVKALSRVGVESVFSEDPHMLVTATGARYGSVSFSETGGYRARIPIIVGKAIGAVAMPARTVGEPDDDDEDPYGPGYGKGPPSSAGSSSSLEKSLTPVLRLPTGNSRIFDTPEAQQQGRLHSIFHASAERLAQGVNRGHLVDSGSKPLIKGVRAKDLKWRCMGCLLGKCRKPSHPASSGFNRATKPWERTYLDSKTFRYASWAGNFCLALALDDSSRDVYPMFARSRHDLNDEFRTFEGQVVKATGHKIHEIKKLRSDNAKEYLSYEMDELSTEVGFHQEFTVPRTPEQDAVERKFESTMALARTLRIINNFPKESWEEMVKTACYLERRLPTLANDNQTPPYTILTGRPVDTHHMHEIGCRAVLHIDKNDPHYEQYKTNGRPGILIGYSDFRKAWRFLVDSRGSIVETDRATFLDKEFDPLPTIETDYVLLPEPAQITWSLDYMDPPVVAVVPAGAPQPPAQVPNAIQPPLAPVAVVPQAGQNRGARGVRRAPAVGLVPSRASNRVVSPIARFHDQRFPSGHRQNPGSALLATKITFAEAIRNPLGKSAVEAEKADLLDNGKVSIVRIPADRIPIGTTWAFKKKSEDLWKGRLCPQGFRQIPGVDFNVNETNAPTISLLGLRYINHVVVNRSMTLSAVDFRSAFSQIPLKEKIFLKSPLGFDLPPGHCLEAHNTLQGFKQGAYNWYKAADEFLRKQGFLPYTLEPAMYRRFVQVGDRRILSIVGAHIDDFKIACDDPKDVEPFLVACESWLPCARRTPDKFVGFNSSYDQANGVILEDQRDAVVELLERFGMSDCRPCSTPAAPGTKLEKNPRQCTDLDVQDFMYEELVGSLRWLSRGDYPEITYSVNHLSAHSTNFNAIHVTAGKRILRYLKGKLDQKMTFRRGKPGELKLRCASDADFMGETENSVTPCRSTSCVTLWFEGQGLLDLISTLQATTSHSTLESEYRAGGLGTRKVRHVRSLLEETEYDLGGPTPFDMDNQATIKVSKNATCSNKLKHIRNDHHQLREGQLEKVIDLQYCPTSLMISDIGTKALPRVDFERHNERLHNGMI